MSFIFEVLLQIFVEFVLGAPGAFILWAARKFDGSFLKILKEDYNKAAIIGLCFWLILFFIFYMALFW